MKSFPPSPPSNRKFGFLFACIFVSLSAYGYYRDVESWKINSWLILGIGVGVISASAPHLLAPFNKAWMKLGEVLGQLTGPLVLGLFYFGLLTPIALITRMAGRDELRLIEEESDTFWIERTPPGPPGDSFKNQF